MISNRLYYQLKPYLPWPVRLAMRRVWAARQRKHVAGVWPINPAAAVPPQGWTGWPGGKKFGVVLTHDVEGQVGLKRCRDVAALEQSLGFRSSFNLIPEGDYSPSAELRTDLNKMGFEVGVHDLKHDGKLFRSRTAFREQSQRINRYLREWGAVGFRSGFMLRHLDWIHDLEIEYDASTFDTDPFEPQPEGAGTIFPFCVGNAFGRSYIELPYTLPQDSTLFIYLREKSIRVWQEKLAWVAEQGGLVLLNTHPDYMAPDGARAGSREYPIALYREFLELLRDQYRDAYWLALPREVARFCKEHTALKPVSRKRVCMIAYTSYESDNRVMRYAEALAARGDTVDVLALQSREGLPSEERIGQVNLFRVQKRIGKNEKNKFAYLLRLVRFSLSTAARVGWRHLSNAYDVVHVHNIPDFLVFSAFVPRLSGSRVILDIHDIVPEFYSNKFGEGSGSTLYKALLAVERTSARFADHVIVSNDLWYQKLLGRSVTREKSSVFLNHVDLRLFHQRSRTRQDGKFILIFPGGLQWHQGVDIAIKAFAKVERELPGAEFHIYGQGSARAGLVQLVDALQLNGKVRFFESVPIATVPELIANADVGVVPKRADSFGNEAYSTKILEFMSQGIPVVASRTRIDEFYFHDGIVSFFDSGDDAQMAARILALARDPSRRAAMVSQASEYVRQNNWQVKQSTYLELVDGLCGGKGHGRSMNAEPMQASIAA